MTGRQLRYYLAASIAVALAATDALSAQTIDEVSGRPTGVIEGVCHISTGRAPFGRSFSGSAVVYRDRYLITAAHNVFSPWYNRITYLAAACGHGDAAGADHREIPLENTRVACGYGWVPKQFARDYAVLQMDAPVRASVPMTVRPFSRTDRLPATATLAGYPGANRQYPRMNAERLFVATGSPRFSNSGPFVDYAIDTFRGNSGGPVWIAEDSGPRLLGIHIAGGRARMVDADFVTDVDRMIAAIENRTGHCG